MSAWHTHVFNHGSNDSSVEEHDGLSFYEEIAKNKEVVKVVLLLTGGVHGLKKQVMEYLSHFRKYEHLWKCDRDAAYDEFVKQ